MIPDDSIIWADASDEVLASMRLGRRQYVLTGTSDDTGPGILDMPSRPGWSVVVLCAVELLRRGHGPVLLGPLTEEETAVVSGKFYERFQLARGWSYRRGFEHRLLLWLPLAWWVDSFVHDITGRVQ